VRPSASGADRGGRAAAQASVPSGGAWARPARPGTANGRCGGQPLPYLLVMTSPSQPATCGSSPGFAAASCPSHGGRPLLIGRRGLRDRVGFGQQQFLHPAAEHGADDVQLVEPDGIRLAGPQARHLPGADRRLTRPGPLLEPPLQPLSRRQDRFWVRGHPHPGESFRGCLSGREPPAPDAAPVPVKPCGQFQRQVPAPVTRPPPVRAAASQPPARCRSRHPHQL
jgi:hypothetical protein